jgi:hypothetical protein
MKNLKNVEAAMLLKTLDKRATPAKIRQHLQIDDEDLDIIFDAKKRPPETLNTHELIAFVPATAANVVWPALAAAIAFPLLGDDINYFKIYNANNVQQGVSYFDSAGHTVGYWFSMPCTKALYDRIAAGIDEHAEIFVNRNQFDRYVKKNKLLAVNPLEPVYIQSVDTILTNPPDL